LIRYREIREIPGIRWNSWKVAFPSKPLTLVANSNRLSLERGEVGAASLGDGIPLIQDAI
jgi:hypothetical protein